MKRNQNVEHEIVNPGPLHDDHGFLAEKGWARSPLLSYRRSALKTPSARMKEWDYYLFDDGAVAVAITIMRIGFIGTLAVSYTDRASARGQGSYPIFPHGKRDIHLGESSGDLGFHHLSNICLLDVGGSADDGISLHLHRDDFLEGMPFDIDVRLSRPPRDSLVMVTPFKGLPRHFYYNRKTLGYRVSGVVSCAFGEHEFEDSSSFGLLDWGRGVWPRDTRWIWGEAMGRVDGHDLCLDVGYGFGDPMPAVEAGVFVDGVLHKLQLARFEREHDLDGRLLRMEPWDLTTADDRLNATFTPIHERANETHAGIMSADMHQVFGSFTGAVVLDDGSVLRFENLPGAVEDNHYRW